jgi:hypothetical protein
MNIVGRNAILALVEETSGHQPFGERRDEEGANNYRELLFYFLFIFAGV